MNQKKKKSRFPAINRFKISGWFLFTWTLLNQQKVLLLRDISDCSRGDWQTEPSSSEVHLYGTLHHHHQLWWFHGLSQRSGVWPGRQCVIQKCVFTAQTVPHKWTDPPSPLRRCQRHGEAWSCCSLWAHVSGWDHLERVSKAGGSAPSGARSENFRLILKSDPNITFVRHVHSSCLVNGFRRVQTRGGRLLLFPIRIWVKVEFLRLRRL